MEKETFDVFCPTCNILVEAKVIARGFGKYRSDAVSPVDEVDCEYHGDHYSVAICRRCNGPFLVREALFGVPGEFETVTDEVVLYPTAGGPRIEGLPDSIGRAVTQAHRSFATASYRCVRRHVSPRLGSAMQGPLCEGKGPGSTVGGS